jgi:hypothetical protein
LRSRRQQRGGKRGGARQQAGAFGGFLAFELLLEELQRSPEGQPALGLVAGGAQHAHLAAHAQLGAEGQQLRATRAGWSIEDHEPAGSGFGTIDSSLDQRDFRVTPEEGHVARRNA